MALLARQGKPPPFPEYEADGACYPDLQSIPQVPGSFIDDAVVSLFISLFRAAGTDDTDLTLVQPRVTSGKSLITFGVAVIYDLDTPIRLKASKSLRVFRDLLIHLGGDAKPVPKIITDIQDLWVLYLPKDTDDG